jgi:hypothetical protein
MATTLESSNSPKRLATSRFSATRSRKRFVMRRSIRIRGWAFRNPEEVQERLLTEDDRNGYPQQTFGRRLS